MTSGASNDNAAASAAAPTPQRIGVPRENFPGEKREATVPDVVTKLAKLGFGVVVETGAGDLADLSDDAYREAGASIAGSATELWSSADIVFKVRPPTADEVALMHEGHALTLDAISVDDFAPSELVAASFAQQPAKHSKAA